MAKPQKENGYTDIANEIVEQLAKLQLSGYETRILWAIFRKTYGYHKTEDWISLSQFQELTNIGKETHISRAIKKLTDRNILTKNGKLFAFNKDYEKWQNLPKLVRGLTKIGLKNDQNRGIQNQKPNITKPTIPNGIEAMPPENPYIIFKETWKKIFGKYPTGGKTLVDFPIKRLVDAYTVNKVCGALLWAEQAREYNQYIPVFKNPKDLEDKWLSVVNEKRKELNEKPKGKNYDE